MKKIKILSENIIENLVKLYKKCDSSKEIPKEIKCPKVQNWLEIHKYCFPIYFYKSWEEKRNPIESGASFLFHDTVNINLISIMEDSDVFSNAAPQNDRTWQKGDVLEFFIQPYGGDSYFELHIAPNLSTLQLKIPDAEDLKANKFKFEDLFTDTDSEFGADIIELKDFKGWWGLISLPAEKNNIKLSSATFAKIAICRYNYIKECEKPECSSSAPLS
ncbi:MAG TPA: hypothetical protein P5105_06860, partial [Victivallales bacterium]|nr:hypothetical protein [Victivallales bacterium]